MMNRTNTIQVTGVLAIGTTRSLKLVADLRKAVGSVSAKVFFDARGNPTKGEVVGLDQGIKEALSKNGWELIPNHRAFEDSEFNFDLACETHRILIEIEKGRSPRLEFYVLKIASACRLNPDKWQFGALIVPSSYIELRLAGRSSPFHYLGNLKPLIEPVIKACGVQGLIVIGYDDPRSKS